jgi:hypothetical protein
MDGYTPAASAPRRLALQQTSAAKTYEIVAGLVMTLTTIVACSRELPPERSSTVAETSTVATAYNPFGAAAAKPFGRPASSTVADPAPVPVEPPPPSRSLAYSLCGDLAENGLGIPNTRRNALAAQLGRPDSATAQPTPNRYNSAQTDSVVNLFYPGLRLHYIVLGVARGETDILLRADVSDNRYLKYTALGVGASVGDIVSALGQPEERTNDTISYSCALHVMEGSTVYFHFEGDRVKFVEYTFYVD